MKKLLGLLVVMTVLATSLVAQAPIEVQFWHAMGGRLGELLTAHTEAYNKSQSVYKVVPLYKGSYAETMTAGIAAFRAGQQPAIIQVFEVGTATMMNAGNAIKPVHVLMAEQKVKFDPAAYLPAVAGYYTTTDGKMLSFPYNSSTPVLYYNKDAFRKAGLDPNKPPKTYKELEEYSKKILGAGFKNALTSSWMSWIHLENFSAWHNVPSGSLQNGFGGSKTELLLNTPLHQKHLQRLLDWQKAGLFVYGGRASAAGPKFINQEVAMITDSSAGYANVKANAKFDFGVSMMPYDDSVNGAPQNSIIGGASLWVFNNLKPEVYKGVAEFFAFLSRTDVQAEYHQQTGYLPITLAAWELTKSQGFYEKNPGTDVSILQMNNKAPTQNSKGLRYGNMVQIRDVVDIQLEAMFGGNQDAKKTLENIVQQGNDLLRRFERSSN